VSVRRPQPSLDRCCEDLARVAAVGDESTARAAELLAVALESSLGRRLQEALAEAALELAATNGVSVNTWLVQALNRVLQPRQSASGSRLTGYGRN
jgi:hypothetical protein